MKILKLLFLVFWVIFCSISVYSQSKEEIDFYQSQLDSLIVNIRLNDSVAKYYKNIYKAENFIMKCNYKKAAEYYEKAFKFIKYPFEKDLTNARICELCSRNNEENIKKYVWYSINKSGYKKGILNNDKYHLLSKWDEIKYMIDTMQSVINKEISEYLEGILYDDQEIRTQARESMEDYYHDSEWGKIIWNMDSINYYKILNLIDEYENIDEKIFEENWYNISVILLHNPQRLDLYIKLHDLVINGKLDARKYIGNLEHSYYKVADKYSFGEESYGFIASPFDGPDNIINEELYVYIIPTMKEKNTINKYRKKLYVEDVKLYHQKCKVQAHNKDLKFRFCANEYVQFWNLDDYYNLILNKRSMNNKKVKIYYKDCVQKRKLKKEAKGYKKSHQKPLGV